MFPPPYRRSLYQLFVALFFIFFLCLEVKNRPPDIRPQYAALVVTAPLETAHNKTIDTPVVKEVFAPPPLPPKPDYRRSLLRRKGRLYQGGLR